jgi:hypothetical protein
MANIQDVRLSRASADFSPQVLVSAMIERTSERLSFKTYQAFIDAVMCGDSASMAELALVLGADEDVLRAQVLGDVDSLKKKRALPYMDSDAYRLLKIATEAFLQLNCTTVTPDALGQDLRFTLDRVDSKDPRDPGRPAAGYLDFIDVTDKEIDIYPVIERIKTKVLNDKLKPGQYAASRAAKQRGSQELSEGKQLDKAADEAAASAVAAPSGDRRQEIVEKIDAIVLDETDLDVEAMVVQIEPMLKELQGDYSRDIADLRAMELDEGAKIIGRSTSRYTLLPYLALIKRKLPDVGVAPLLAPEEAALCYRIAQERLTNPCFVELIWSYWHEQGMLIQTLNAISRRFQNVRGPNGKDPLAMLEIGYLRPLNNLLWGYIQDEQHRLSLVRRTYEYDHHYGLTLEGAAVPKLRPADSRSKFLEAFHNLLYLCTVFFKQDDDTTVRADAFPILNALKDVHMLLTMGQHNQFGDLTSTARGEMLMQQWLLARPEFRELLPTRESVVYPEPWMERVDAMKSLQGWLDTSVLHFHDMAVYGEQLLLSIRFIEWSAIDDAAAAGLWVRFWRSKIQGYIYAYHAATGVDLTASPVEPQQARLRVMQPSALLRQRLETGSSVPTLPPGAERLALPSFRERRAMRRVS